MQMPKFGIRDYIFRSVSIKNLVTQYSACKTKEDKSSFFPEYFRDENGHLRAQCWFCKHGKRGETDNYDLVIDTNHDTYRCLECKEEGDMIKLVMELEQCDEKTAIKNIIESLEIKVPARFLKELD